MRMKATTLTLDEKSREAVNDLPRSVSASAIMRVLLKAISMSEKEFEKYKASSDEAQEVRDFFREKVRLSNIRSLIL